VLSCLTDVVLKEFVRVEALEDGDPRVNAGVLRMKRVGGLDGGLQPLCTVVAIGAGGARIHAAAIPSSSLLIRGSGYWWWRA